MCPEETNGTMRWPMTTRPSPWTDTFCSQPSFNKKSDQMLNAAPTEKVGAGWTAMAGERAYKARPVHLS
jgi:hypothetical protein